MGLSTEGSGAGLVRFLRRKERKKEKAKRIPLGREPEQRQLLFMMDTVKFITVVCHTPAGTVL